jgi:hypothetical protein
MTAVREHRNRLTREAEREHLMRAVATSRWGRSARRTR